MASDQVKKVFLSSTARDLTAYREEVYRAVEGLDGCHCVRMEDFGARDCEADEFCRVKVAECDVFVGIAGHLYGSCPEGSDKSYTEREYDAAIEAKKPRLMFLARQDFPLPANLIEPDEKREKQQAFRQRASSDRIRDTFASPQDLARRVVQAIRNWEQGQQVAEKGPSDQPQIALPLPPQAYFAHAYPMQEHFTGRVAERGMLTGWLTGDDHPVLSLVAIGGMGKSALAWAWVQRDVLGLSLPGWPQDTCETACGVAGPARPEGLMWWSFYEGESTFQGFVEEALRYASGGTVDVDALKGPGQRLWALASLLQQRRILLVLDGFERALRAYAGLGGAYQGDDLQKAEGEGHRACIDPHAADFLRWAAGGPMAGRVLLTTRLHPVELDGCAGCRREELTGLHPDDAVAFFHAHGVEGTRAEIQEACAPYEYHPLALRLLAGVVVKDRRNPRDIEAAKRHLILGDLKGGKGQHHILHAAYETLDKTKQALLSRIAAFRAPMDYDALLVCNRYKKEERFEAALDDLIERGLLLHDAEGNRYDLHPIIRRYAYGRLTDKAGVHARLRDYFGALPTPEKIERLGDLEPTIELYHHTVRAGRYDEAFDLFYGRLNTALYYQLAAYSAFIELQRALFAEGDFSKPLLDADSRVARLLNDTANCYSLSGRPRRAVPLFEMHNALRDKADDKTNLAIGLGNLAHIAQIHLGELASAEANLRRSIELCREVEDAFWEAVARRELGRLLVYRGAFEKAHDELGKALDGFEKQDEIQSQGIVWAYRALRALLMGDAAAALEAARRARQLAEERAYERDFIRAEWLIGWALVALADEDAEGKDARLAEAEGHLTETLTRCRRINMVEMEPDILLAWARWHRAKGSPAEARAHAEEALAIADRCEYRLVQADCHNLLALLDSEEGEKDSAVMHARTACERAWCDGPPHCYKAALDEAKRLLDELGAEPPEMA